MLWFLVLLRLPVKKRERVVFFFISKNEVITFYPELILRSFNDVLMDSIASAYVTLSLCMQQNV